MYLRRGESCVDSSASRSTRGIRMSPTIGACRSARGSHRRGPLCRSTISNPRLRRRIRPLHCLLAFPAALWSFYAPSDVLVARTVADVAGTRLIQCDQEFVMCAGTDRRKKWSRGFWFPTMRRRLRKRRPLWARRAMPSTWRACMCWPPRGSIGVRAIAIRAISDAADSSLAARFRTGCSASVAR